ncbi:MAG TPA: YicC family protein [Sedimentisphaerales bacterium]|nr:YicC family protein [Sedimentisphaerales bacterium]
MIYSMTGYGYAEGEFDGIVYSVELKAVNNRYLKYRVKLPDNVAFLETPIESLLKEKLYRGTVNCTVAYKNAPATALFDLDEGSLKSYVEKLNAISASLNNCGQVDIASLLSLPGIVVPAVPDNEKKEGLREFITAITLKAIEELVNMRQVEGQSLVNDLEENCGIISADLERITKRVDIVLQQYHDKLQKRVDFLLDNVKLELDEPTLAREVAVFAERSDISEELSRLASHLQQFSESCEKEGQAGRRLDFITQEMLREANTIASKACDSEISLLVVDIKCRIDRIKEQVQNVE